MPIEEKFEEAHRQLPPSALPSTTTPRTVVGATPSPRVRTTPVQFRTLAVTVSSFVNSIRRSRYFSCCRSPVVME